MVTIISSITKYGKGIEFTGNTEAEAAGFLLRELNKSGIASSSVIKGIDYNVAPFSSVGFDSFKQRILSFDQPMSRRTAGYQRFLSR